MSLHRCDCCGEPECESGTSIRYFRYRDASLTFSNTQTATGTRTTTHSSGNYCLCRDYSSTPSDPELGVVFGSGAYGFNSGALYAGTVSSSLSQDFSVSGGLAIRTSDLGAFNTFDPATETGTVTFPSVLSETSNGTDQLDTDTWANGWICPSASGTTAIGAYGRVSTSGSCRFRGSGYTLDRTGSLVGAGGAAWASDTESSGLTATTFGDVTETSGKTARDVDTASVISEAVYDIELKCSWSALGDATVTGADAAGVAASSLESDVSPSFYVRIAIAPNGNYAAFAILQGADVPADETLGGDQEYDRTMTQPTGSISLSITGITFDSNNCINQLDVAVSGTCGVSGTETGETPTPVNTTQTCTTAEPDLTYDYEDDFTQTESISGSFSFSIRLQAF